MSAKKQYSKTSDITKVIFRKEKTKPYEVFALFPEIPGSVSAHTCLSYQHVGQHSAAEYNHCIRTSRPAKPEEYKALKKELEQIGYVLDIRSRSGRRDYQTRKESL